jgi:hypothetical protein
MSDRQPPAQRPGHVGPTEPLGSAGTEPLRPPVVPAGKTRRGGPAIPGGLLAAGIAILVAVFILGFVVRGLGDDDPAPAGDGTEQAGEGGGAQGGGGRQDGQRRERRRASRACRRALGLSQQVVGVQTQLLANRGQFAEALVAEDTALIEELNAQSDQLLAQIASLQEGLDRQIRRCL